jgi:hypothetical protein
MLWCAYEIDTHDQLGFTSASALNFDSVSVRILRRCHALSAGGCWGSILRRTAILWRTTRWRRRTHLLCRMSRRISRGGGVDRGRSAHHLGRWCARCRYRERRLCTSKACGSRCVIVRIRWWSSSTGSRMIHGKTCSRGRGCRGEGEGNGSRSKSTREQLRSG